MKRRERRRSRSINVSVIASAVFDAWQLWPHPNRCSGCVLALLVGIVHASIVLAQAPPTVVNNTSSEIEGLRQQLTEFQASLETVQNDVSELKAKQQNEEKLVETKNDLEKAVLALDEARKDIASLESDRDTARDKIQENDKSILNIANEQDKLFWGTGVLLVVIGLIGTAAYFQLRQWAQTQIVTMLRNFTNRIEASIGQRFDVEKQEFESDNNARFALLDRQISDLVMLTQRAERGQHDDAIEKLGWDGKNETLQAYPVEIQKLIIRSILLAGHTSPNSRNVAWAAAEAIFRADESEANLSFLYELASDGRAWSRGYELYKAHGAKVPITSNAAGFCDLLRILRRNLRYSDAIRVEKSYTGRSTTEIVHILAHLKNNMGRFEDADKLLRPKIDEFMTSGRKRQRSNWPALTYSYLKNCNEWGKPEQGLDVAHFSVRMSGDALLQLGVLRLALHLEKLGESGVAGELIKGIEKNIEFLPEDATTWQIQARLMARKPGPSNIDAAIKFLRDRDGLVKSGEATTLDPERANYFFQCLIGELLIEAGRYDEARRQLHELSLNDEVGEALFLIANSHAKQGEKHDDEATQFLDRAGIVHRRWCLIAQLVALYPELVESHKRTKRQPCASVPEIKS